MPNFISSYLKRIKLLGDKSAMLLIIPCVLALFFIDDAMAKTLVQWLVFAPVVVGVAIILSRIVFHQVDLTKLVQEVHGGNTAAAILSSGLMVFVGLLIYSLVTWAKA